MKVNLKVWHLFIAFCIALIVIRFVSIVEIISLFFSYLILLVTDFPNAINQLSFGLIDHFTSGALIILLPLIIFFKIKNRKIFQSKLDFSSLVIGTLVLVFIFSPLISYSHPDFQKNVGLTKLLPPFSRAIFLKLEHKTAEEPLRFDKFIKLKNTVLKSAFDEDLVFVDSIQLGEKILYFQNQNTVEVPIDSLRATRIIPTLNKKFFLLGTDEFGRDIFARLVYGARISIFVGVCAVLVSFLIGFILGSASGYFGGRTDLALNRLTDTFLSFPSIFLIIIILALFGNSMLVVIIVLGFSGWMSLFKIVRSEVISLKQKDFFISARMIGLSQKQLLLKEVLPVILTPIVVNLVFLFSSVILAEAALSYLGLGTGSNHPSWGSMIDAGQNYLKDAWWMILFPGLALIITLYSANDIGQKIKMHFNPQLRK
jgi:peptide/nickel transport system permease protein